MKLIESITYTAGRQIKDQLNQLAVMLLFKNKYCPPE
jgi:hypothetical protein